jgi:PST family polysaccharide transporter
MMIASQAIKLPLQIGTTAILARLLSVDEFGLFSLVMPIVAFFTIFYDLGLGSAAIFKESLSASEINCLFWINVLAGILLASVLFGLAPFAAQWYGDPRLSAVLATMGFLFILNGISAQYLALQQRRFAFGTIAMLDVVGSLCGAVASVMAALLGAGYWALVVLTFTGQVIRLFGLAAKSQWQPGWPRWDARVGQLIRFGGAVSVFNIINYFSRNIDNLLIGKYWGMEALGYYGRAYNLMLTPLSQIIYPLSQVVVSTLTRCNRDEQLYVGTYLKLMRAILIVCVPLVAWMIVCRESLIVFVLGEKWTNAAPLFGALGLSGLIQPLNNSGGWLMMSQGRARDVLVLGVVGSGSAICCILAGLHWGPLYVAWAYSLGQILIATPILWFLVCRKGYVKIRHVAGVAIPPLLSAAVPAISLELFITMNKAVSTVPAFIFLVAGAAWVFGVHFVLICFTRSGRGTIEMGWRAIKAMAAEMFQRSVRA